MAKKMKQPKFQEILSKLLEFKEYVRKNEEFELTKLTNVGPRSAVTTHAPTTSQTAATDAVTSQASSSTSADATEAMTSQSSKASLTTFANAADPVLAYQPVTPNVKNMRIVPGSYKINQFL